jgi:hypothetical protein
MMTLYSVIYWELTRKADWQKVINAQGSRSLPQSQTHQTNRSSNSLLVLIEICGAPV